MPVSSPTIAAVAPTLADLKRLPLERQAALLLGRLAVIYPQTQGAGGLHKGNLMMGGDIYGLAAGYAEPEKLAIVRHLLGGPWTFLVNQGFLVDPAGSGFHALSEEGIAALANDQVTSGADGPSKKASAHQEPRKSTKLRTAIVLNVLIASPSDVGKERDVVTKAILAWNAAHFSSTGIMLNPVRWETHSYPESGNRPQAIINRQIVDEGHLLIAIFGNRLGTPTGTAQSGTIEEIERFRNAGKHVALYFSTADVPRAADRQELAALEQYQRERQKDTLYSTFDTADELHERVAQHLPHIVAQVYESLTSSHELEGLEEELRSTQQQSTQRLREVVDHQTTEYETERRVAASFDETKPLIPEYQGNSDPTYAYQTWLVRPRQSLRLRLDRALDSSVRGAMERHFKSVVPGQFCSPVMKAHSHTVRWQSRVSGDAVLTYVRHVEITDEGAVRYCERLDRHDTRQESVSDLFIESLNFWSFLADFYATHNYGGSLSTVHRIDCTADVRLFGSFPDERGSYHRPNAIIFPDAMSYGIATKSSRVVREVVLFSTHEYRQDVVADSMLAHLREQCGASVDYEGLRKILRAMPEIAPVPRY